MVFEPIRNHPNVESPVPHNESAAPSADGPEAEPNLMVDRFVTACSISSGLTFTFDSG